MILDYLGKNVANAKAILKLAIPVVGKMKKFSASEALKFAIVTNRDLIPAKRKKELEVIIGKYIR